MHLKFVFFVLGITVLSFSEADSRTEAAIKVLEIVSGRGYHKSVRPPNNGSVSVGINILITHFSSVDSMDREMTTDLILRMRWTDQRLKFSNDDVDSVKFSDPKLFWTPDLYFSNGVMSNGGLLEGQSVISISNNGNVTLSTRLQVSTFCPMDFHNFPYDEQMCQMTLQSYGFNEEDVLLYIQDSDGTKLVSSASVKEFELLKIETKRLTARYTSGLYSVIQVEIYLKRLTNYYIVYWFIPCICLVCVSLASLFVNPEALALQMALTLGPFAILFMCSSTFVKVPIANYPKVGEIFTGTSLITIFVTLMRVVWLSNRVTSDTEKEPNSSNGDSSKFTAWKNFLVKNFDRFLKWVIVAFYSSFVIIFFIVHSTGG